MAHIAIIVFLGLYRGYIGVLHCRDDANYRGMLS